MPLYQYTALDRFGRTVTGSVEAADNAAVRRKLERGSYAPEAISPIHTAVVEADRVAMPFEAGPPAQASAPARLPVTVPSKDLVSFYRQMSGMVRSGLPVVQALVSVRNCTRNPTLRRALADMEAAASFGRPMSEAMDRHPRAFGRGHVGLVRMGEGTGRLQQSLESLADQMQADWSVEAATRYNPVLVCTRYFLAPFVLFFTFGANSGALFSLIGPFLLSLIGFVAYPFIRQSSRWTRFGRRLDEFLARVPGISARRRRADRVRTIGALAAALDAGLPTSLAWELASEAPDVDKSRNAMVAQQRRVVLGSPVSDALEATGIFDASYIRAARSGELSGRLPETLWRALQYDKKEAALIADLTPWLLGLAAYTLYLIVGSYAVVAAWARLASG